ncbi:NACHT, LRR and PYD domains-containing protein 1b allele 2-like [Scyliorhinus torazame]|uniref:NACHT, LRR and PYD domains-containing protein 1b allele 2-like n=1 Tax=Scyliorhinus torazame TaxID=75743 RepID=UPI003B59055C
MEMLKGKAAGTFTCVQHSPICFTQPYMEVTEALFMKMYKRAGICSNIWFPANAAAIDCTYGLENSLAIFCQIKQSKTISLLLPDCKQNEDKKLRYTFAIFYVEDRSYQVQKPSEVHQTHLALKVPTFSLMGVIVDKQSPFAFHSVAMIYQIPSTDAQILHIYVVPNDFSIIQSVHMQESQSTMLEYPSQIQSLYFGRKYSLLSPADVLITPEELKFHYIDMDSKQLFFEVLIQDDHSNLELKLTKRKKIDPLWKTELKVENGKISSLTDSAIKDENKEETPLSSPTAQKEVIVSAMTPRRAT